MAFLVAVECKADLILVSEPNKKLVGGSSSWVTDIALDTAVCWRNREMGVDVVERKQGYMYVRMGGIAIYNVYISPNIPLAEFRDRVEEIMDGVRCRGEEAIIAGDFNAKSPLWGAPAADARGEILAEWGATLDLVVLNDGSPTFVRRNTESHIDVTFVTKNIASKMGDWRVLEEESMSLHKCITFEYRLGGDISPRRKNNPKMNHYGIIDRTKLKTLLGDQLRKLGTGIHTVEKLTRVLKKAQDAVNGTSHRRGHGKPYWWNYEIEGKREECLRARRRLTRGRDRNGGVPGEAGDLLGVLKNLRKQLRRLIEKAQRDSWLGLCRDLEDDVWGAGYRIAMKALKGGGAPFSLGKEAKMEIARSLFPQGESPRWERRRWEVEPFSMDELEKAGSRLKTGRAPGMDGVKAESLKAMIEVAPETLLGIYNSFWVNQSFPERWRRARLALIPKPGKKNLFEASAYRPICLIDAAAKVYEYMVKERLEQELERGLGLSERQFGFRGGRSTVDAIEYVVGKVEEVTQGFCLLVTFDVRNAFNTVPWDVVIGKVAEKAGDGATVEVLRSYLGDRWIMVDADTVLETYMGVPQGSVLGPTLWNVAYDDVLDVRLPADCFSVAYADDLAVVVRASGKQELVDKTEIVIDKVEGWMRANRLRLAVEKSEIVIFPRGRRRLGEVEFAHGPTTIISKRQVKYLGVWVDEYLSFRYHTTQTTQKAEASLAALRRLTPNVGGPGSMKRRMLYGVMQSILTYAAPIWSRVLGMDKYRKMLISVQRRGLLRVSSAYRTVSAAAVQVVTGQVPLDLLVEERVRLFRAGDGGNPDARVRERGVTLRRWQSRWEETTDVAQWTKRLIPNLGSWVECPYREVGYFTTQFLTGHGCFKTYLLRMKKREEDRCPYCGVSDSPEHVAFYCARWQEERGILEDGIGEKVTPENMLRVMLSGESNYSSIKGFIIKILQQKERDERLSE